VLLLNLSLFLGLGLLKVSLLLLSLLFNLVAIALSFLVLLETLFSFLDQIADREPEILGSFRDVLKCLVQLHLLHLRPNLDT